MKMKSQVDNFNRVKRFLKTGGILTVVVLVVLLTVMFFAVRQVPLLLKLGQLESGYTNQQLIAHELHLLVSNIEGFERQLQRVSKDEIAPEELHSLLYGKQPASLDYIFEKIVEIEQMATGNKTSDENSLATLKVSLILSVLAIMFLSFMGVTLCLSLLIVFLLVGKQTSHLLDFQKTIPELKQGSRIEGSSFYRPSSSGVSDPLVVFIGKDAAENILGAMYQAVYAYEHQMADVRIEYLVNITSRFLDLFQSRYDLHPIGKPGEGPIEYDPQQHVCWEFAHEGEPVWVVQPGWSHKSEVYAKALVSKKKRPIIS